MSLFFFYVGSKPCSALTTSLWNVLAAVNLHDWYTRVKHSGLTLIKDLVSQKVSHCVHFVLSCSGIYKNLSGNQGNVSNFGPLAFCLLVFNFACIFYIFFLSSTDLPLTVDHVY